jgi:UDP:flavonoid glycosyltransferase YjiC (YdhE family)
MRKILFTFAGGLGHLKPMLPVAKVLRDRGHQVGVCGQADIIEGVDKFDAYFPTDTPTSPPADRPTGILRQPDLDHELSVVGTYFAGTLAARRVTAVEQAIELWTPDLIVCDEMDFGSSIAAQKHEIPCAVVTVIATGALTRVEHVARPLAQLRSAHGLSPTGGPVTQERNLVISPFPASLRHPGFPLPDSALSIRPDSTRDDGGCAAVEWFTDGTELHQVYVTLGTVFNTESGDLFVRVLEGLSKLPARILATVGRNVDPDAIGITAENVRVEQFVPQSAVLPHCDLVVNHAGSGSVVGALTHGVPMITLPMGADQELNAERLVELEAGLRLDPIALTPAQLYETALDALASNELRAGARRISREIEDMPPSETIVGSLETLMTLRD